MSSHIVLTTFPGGCFLDEEPETKSDRTCCQEQEDIHSRSQWRPQNFHVRGARRQLLSWNEHLERYHEAAFASFAFSNKAFNHILHCWHIQCYFNFVLGWLVGAVEDGARAPPSRPQALLGNLWGESRFGPWSDSKAHADLMVNRKNVAEDLFCCFCTSFKLI